LAVAIRVEQIMYTDLEALEKEKKAEEKQAEQIPAEKKVKEKQTGPLPGEKSAAALPSFDPKNYSEIIKDKQFVDLRNEAVKKARSVYFLAIGRDVAASVGYLLLSVLAFKIPALELAAGFGFMVGIIGLFLVFLRFLFHSNEFRPLNAGTDKFRNPIFELIGTITQPGNQSVFFVYVVLMALSLLVSAIADKQLLSAVAVLLLVGLHSALIYFMKPRNDRNIKLLILRTFQINSNTSFTFEKLSRFWKHVGSIFTIVDSSYLLYTYRIFSPRNLIYLILLVLPSVIGLIKGTNVALTILFTILLLAAIITFEISMINLNVIKSLDGFLNRLTRFLRNPRDLATLTFKNMPTVNYGNVWDKSVLELVRRSELVLMDLRGFSAAKKGCEFEINLLMDQKRVDQILFLISAKDRANFDLIFQTIIEKWKYQLEQSPNVNLKEPKIQVYIATDESDKDVQGLYDRLLMIADSTKAVEPVIGS
jgi:hypothetical protein